MEPLTLIGMVFANQHIFFLFPESQLLSRIYLPSVIVFMGYMQRKFLENVRIWDPSVELSIQSFDRSWLIIFLFHYLGAKNLTTSYRLTLIHNMSIQEELKDTLDLLEKTNKDLKGAIQARELFIASVSHELRNPLNGLMGNIELLRLEVKNEKWLKALDTCKISSEILLGQINNVLDVAKINAEKLELHTQPENFHKLVEKVWKISEISIKQKKLQGELHIAQDFPKYIELDSHRLTQILLNLIGNASKFCKEGFINVVITWHPNARIETLRRPTHAFVSHKNERILSSSTNLLPKDKRRQRSYTDLAFYEYEDTEKRFTNMNDILQRKFDVKSLRDVENTSVSYSLHDFTKNVSDGIFDTNEVEKKNGIIKIEVVDSGCGMTKEAVSNLFKPFSQADSSITRKFGGTGLGLYITKQIIQKMGGEIHAYSKEGQGSTFCVLIPTQTANKSEVPQEAESNNNKIKDDFHQLPEGKALIVDDLQDNQFILTNYLDKLNIQTDIACNGQEALDLFKSKPPGYYSFITMDLQMPIMDGLTASREIRKYELKLNSGIEVPIIVITGNCAETEKFKCLNPTGEIRAFNFFRKPFTFWECKSVVQAILTNNNQIKKCERLPSKF